MPLFKQRDDDLVRLKVFDNAMAAHALRLLLEANGVEVCVSGEESAAVFSGIGLTNSGMVGVQVLVRRSDLEEARQVMLEVPAACEILIPAWNCRCGATVDQGFSVCWSCGDELPDSHSPEE